MMIERNNFIFKSARFIFEDEALRCAIEKKQYSYITGLSYDGEFMKEFVSQKSKKTPIIRLKEESLESIFKKFSDTTRNEIRKTEKIPGFVFVLPDKDRGKIYDLYKNFEVHGARPPRKREYSEKSIFAGAYFQNKLIAAIISYDARPYIRVNAIVSLDKNIFPERKYISYATRRLVWELVGFGKEHGYRWIDLGGVNLVEKEKLGIAAFKVSFGGELVDEFTYTYKSKLFRYAHSFLYKGR